MSDRTDLERTLHRVLYGDPKLSEFSYNGLSSFSTSSGDIASIAPDESSWLTGPVGLFALQGLDTLLGNPGLIVQGEGGIPTPVININKPLQDTGLGSFQQYLADLNSNVFATSGSTYSRIQSDKIASLFDEQSLFAKLREYASGSFGDALDSFASLARSPQGSPYLKQLSNYLTGYDEGAGVGIAGSRSLDMASGLLASGKLAGIQNDEFVDIAGKEFTDLRKSLASMVAGAAHNLTFDSLGHKNNDIVHGGSEALTTTILSDAIRRGELKIDEQAQTSLKAGESTKNLFSGDSPITLQDILNAQSNVESQYSAKADQLNKLESRKAQLQERKTSLQAQNPEADTSELDANLKETDTQIKKVKEDMTALANTASTLGDAVADSGKELISGVTSAVDVLKTFYGDETSAKQALDRLTGGRGSYDAKAAQSVQRQMEAIRDAAILSGYSPRDAAVLLSMMQQQSMTHGSQIAQGGAFAGATALALTNMQFNTLRQFSNDPRKQHRIQQAFVDFAGSYDKSEGKRFSILLESARQTGRIDNETYGRLRDAATSGDYTEFAKARDELFVRTTGSVRNGSRLFHNEQAMADLAGQLDVESIQNVGAFATEAIQGDLGRRADQGKDRYAETQVEDRLLEQGYNAQEIRKIRDEATTGAIDTVLNSNSSVKGAYEKLVSYYEDQGKTKDEAHRLANNWLLQSKNLLTEDERKTLKTVIHNNLMKAYEGKETLISENELALVTSDETLSKYFNRIGAIGKSGKLSAEAFTGAVNDTLTSLMKNAGVLKLDSDDLSKKRKEILEGLKSDNSEAREAAIKAFQNLIRPILQDENNIPIIGEDLQYANKYRTSDVKDNEVISKLTEEEKQTWETGPAVVRDRLREAVKQRQNDIDRVGATAETARSISGMSTTDTAYLLASVSDSLQSGYATIGDLTEDERKSYEELLQKETRGDISDTEKGTLAGLKSKSKYKKYDLEKSHDSQQKEGLDKAEGIGPGIMGVLSGSEKLDTFIQKFKPAGVALEDFQKAIQNVVKKITGISDDTPDAGEDSSEAPQTEARRSSGTPGIEGGSAEDMAALLPAIKENTEAATRLLAKLEVLATASETANLLQSTTYSLA